MSRDLADHLTRRILLEGPLTVATFMGEVLGHPRWGYYITRDPLGASGDFVTAPEISQMFGELLGLWCADTWLRMGAPERVAVVELGPGRGTLMADALRAFAAVPGLRSAAAVHLVETSPALRSRQAATLAPVMSGMAPPVWHHGIDTLPDGVPLLVIANEFFDALPIRQIQRDSGGWAERLVDIDEAATAAAGGEPRFRWVLESGRGPGRRAVPESLRDAPPGSVFEWSPASVAIASALGARLAVQRGAAIVVDYGYAGPAIGDTLQAVRGHSFAPVLDGVGAADLTAHVDFTALAAAAREAGAATSALVEQGAFLRLLGIDARAAALQQASPARAAEIWQAHRRLTDPVEMGKLFKALAFFSPALDIPAGFSM